MEILNQIFNFACVFTLAAFVVYWAVVPLFTTPFYAAKVQDILAIFSLVNLDSKDKFIDLGSGDGRVVLAASRVCKKAVGVEINPFLTLLARFIAILSANGEIKFINADYNRVNLKDYNVVYVYLFPSKMAKLKQKLERELKPGSKVVTHSFRIKGWKEVDSIKEGKHTHYLYKI